MTALVIGGGPAGLMAADALAVAGRRVILADAKPSVGRKFLMAGRSGLNITKSEKLDKFLENFDPNVDALHDILSAFDPDEVQKWANALGQETFVGSSGRVFPKAMKASPLLRAWLAQLGTKSVEVRTRWQWIGWDEAFHFDTPNGPEQIKPDVTVLALGGASWSRLGSDGQWARLMQNHEIPFVPFAPANAGLSVDWSSHMHRHFGEPVKAVALSCGDTRSRGEFVVSHKGLEGSGIYAMSQALRQGHTLQLDLMPDWSIGKINERLATPRGKTTVANHLRKTLRLDPVKIALLMEFGRPLPDTPALSALIKSLPIKHQGFRPIDEAISTAGGISWDSVDANLMLKNAPGVFVAGEMLDWEAPTGGYLITGCLATGKWAGQNAAEWCS
jgi:uncharacterized flavoprotein (TIGR03862 family)